MRYNKKEEIGKLRERIIVQSVSRAIGTTGFGTETWSNFAEVWALVDYKGINKEEVEGGKITALSQVRVTCRYRTATSVDSLPYITFPIMILARIF